MMTEKDIQKLKRTDLLEILVEQGKEIERLRLENEELQKKLNDRTISIDNAGTIAEASFLLNGVFEAAQAAATQYLENVQHMSERQEAKCSEMEESMRQKCLEMEQATEQKCAEMLKNATQGVEERWAELSRRLEVFYDAHKGLREMMAFVGSLKTD